MCTTLDSLSDNLVQDSSSCSPALNSLNSNEWQTAINAGFQSLLKNNSWELVPLPSNCTTIGYKWILETKYGPYNNTINKKLAL